MYKLIIAFLSAILLAQTSQVQIVHNSPYPTVDVYVNGSVALENVAYRENTGLLDLPTNLEVGIAPAGGDVIATFPFELAVNESYVVVASGILNNDAHPFELLASTLDETAEDDNSFALKVMHGVTDAPAVDIYANGNLLVDSLAYGEFQGYLQVPSADYTLDITTHGSSESVVSFSAPLSGLGGGSGVVYASGFLSPAETDSAFTLMLVTSSGYSVELPSDETALSNVFEENNIPSNHLVVQNYPNPFNPVTNINYVIFEKSYVEITIYDILGNVVNNLYNGYQSVGTKTLKWDATNNVGDLIGSGVYFYKVQVGESFSVNRMMYLK